MIVIARKKGTIYISEALEENVQKFRDRGFEVEVEESALEKRLRQLETKVTTIDERTRDSGGRT